MSLIPSNPAKEFYKKQYQLQRLKASNNHAKAAQHTNLIELTLELHKVDDWKWREWGLSLDFIVRVEIQVEQQLTKHVESPDFYTGIYRKSIALNIQPLHKRLESFKEHKKRKSQFISKCDAIFYLGIPF